MICAVWRPNGKSISARDAPRAQHRLGRGALVIAKVAGIDIEVLELDVRELFARKELFNAIREPSE